MLIKEKTETTLDGLTKLDIISGQRGFNKYISFKIWLTDLWCSAFGYKVK
jgi:hypothetical protein